METTETITACRDTEPSRKAKYLQTAIISSVYFILGILQGQEGVAFLDLVFITSSDIAIGSNLFTARSIGYGIGVIAIGPLFDKFNNDILCCMYIFLAGVTTIIIPWCRSIYLMIFIFGLRSVFSGPSDLGVIVMCSSIWLAEAGPFLQSLQFLFALGGIIAPFITEPFLLHQHNITYSTTTETGGGMLNISIINSNVWNGSVNNMSLPEKLPSLNSSDVSVAFALTGGILLTVCLLYCGKIVTSSAGEFGRFSKRTGERVNVYRPNQLALFNLPGKISCLVILGMHYFSYGCVDSFLRGFLRTFTVEHLNWSTKNGSMATTVFWTGLAAGRFLGVIFIKILRPTGLLAINLTALFCSLGAMLLADGLLWSSTVWWILIGTSGLSLSSVVATSHCWLNENLTPISGKLLSYIFVWDLLGGISHMSLLGYLFDDFSPMWFVYLSLIHSGLMLFSAAVLFLVVRNFKIGRFPDVLESVQLKNRNDAIIADVITGPNKADI